MSDIVTRRDGDILLIGDEPQLIVNIRTQNNYIRIGKNKVPYLREVALSEDLLEGKRKNV